MSERLKFILFIVFSLTIFWFTIILLCLPQSEPWPPANPNALTMDYQDDRYHDQVRPSNKAIWSEPRPRYGEAPRTSDFMHLFRSKSLSLLDTIFYQFDPSQDVTNLTGTQLVLSESDHKVATQRLSLHNGPTDEYVKLRGDHLFSFNLLASNRVGLLRPLPDTRQDKCPKLPPAPITRATYTSSIVICYYNEAPSALLRTIYSILARTQLNLLNEIIIVDDFSEPGFDMATIEPHLERFAKNYGGLVRFVRTSEREGLIRARLFGAAMAKGDILIFLDSHVEPNVGWLEPLISVIQENQTTIACPMIDLINAETMLYTASPMVKGGLSWALHFKWASVPANTLKTYDDFVKPIKSPSMAGGLYAIHRDYFYRLGAYDPGMNLWGGENIELSLKTWMCGGQILIMPCSRVGHIFRKTRPYGPKPGEPDSLTYNSHRVARVWLDEHVDKYYEMVPQTRNLDSGDISERVELRRSLRCQNFTWFLDNVYPEMREQEPSEKRETETKKKPGSLFNSKRINRSVGRRKSALLPFSERTQDDQLRFDNRHDPFQRDPTSDLSSGDEPSSLHFGPSHYHKPSVKVISNFQIQLINSNLCLEPKMTLMTGMKFSRLVLNNCTDNVNQGNISRSVVNQMWSLTETHEIRLGVSYCLDIMKNLPLLRRCHGMGSYQAWTQFNQTQGTQGTQIMSHPRGNLCLAVERAQRGEPIIVTICDITNHEDSLESLPVARDAMQIQHRPSRQRQHHKSSEDILTKNNDGDGVGWLTGPLPLQLINHHRGFEDTSLKIHQRWNLVAHHEQLQPHM